MVFHIIRYKMFAVLSACFLLITIFSVFIYPVSAAEPKVKVSVSSNLTNPRVGQTILLTVSLNVENGGGTLIYSFNDLKIGYDISLFEFDESGSTPVASDDITIVSGNPVVISYRRNGDACEDINDEIARLRFKVKPTAVLGETSFTVSAGSFLGKDGKDINFSCTSPYTGVTVADKMSDNNFLANLIVNEGTLSPGFKKDTTKYTVKVSNEVTRINLVYKPEDAAARVTVTNASNLKIGNNTVKVSVTAENGSSRVYTITVVRAAEKGNSENMITSSEQGASYSSDQLNKEIRKVKNRYLIIILVLVFAVLAELAYILIEKFAKKKPAAVTAENAAVPESKAENEEDDDIGEPQSIIDSILNNTDDENKNN